MVRGCPCRYPRAHCPRGGSVSPPVHACAPPSGRRVWLQVPVRALSLVDGGRAAGAVLVAEPGGAGHVVVGHRGRLHRLQGLVGRVAPVDRIIDQNVCLGVIKTGEFCNLACTETAPRLQPLLIVTAVTWSDQIGSDYVALDGLSLV